MSVATGLSTAWARIHSGITGTTRTILLRFSETASGVNFLEIVNAATGNAPSIGTASNTDTNAALTVHSLGTGSVVVKTGGASGRTVLTAANVASSVNGFTVTPAIATAAPSIAPSGTDTHISHAVGVKGTANILLRALPLYKTGTITQITTAGAGTYTAAQLLVGVINRDPAGGDRTDTLDTAEALVGAIPGVAVGDTLEVIVQNNADMAETITIAAGAGGTDKTIAAGRTIGQNLTRRILIKFTNVTAAMHAYDLYVV